MAYPNSKIVATKILHLLTLCYRLSSQREKILVTGFEFGYIATAFYFNTGCFGLK